MLKQLIALTVTLLFPLQALAAVEPYKQTFVTTAYYSPLPDQEHYATGSYYGDTRLNGNGTNGASGAEVFPGMLAAPKSYPFGFKIDIPGIGISEVQDRGGAIVNAGVRGDSHDRLDIWMGAGDAGLKRALQWGKRTVTATVYEVNDSVAITASFDGFDHNEIELVRYWKDNKTEAGQAGVSTVATLFPKDLWFGESSDKVKELQTLLADLGYFYDPVDGEFNDATAQAVYHFQRDNDIIYDWNELGAGHFGPQTRATIEVAKKEYEEGTYINQTKYLEELSKHEDLKEDFSVFTDNLYSGVSNDDVVKLQEQLHTLGYLRTEPTGTYGEVTENAVMRFQLKQGIIASKSDTGAGVLGPQTRAALNNLFDERVAFKGAIAMNRSNNSDIIIASTNTTDMSLEELIEAELRNADSEEMVEVEQTVAEDEVKPEYITFGSRGADVKELQSKLRDQGYFDSGFLTTYFGEKTKASLIAFQLDNGVIKNSADPNAGVLNDTTYNLLF